MLTGRDACESATIPFMPAIVGEWLERMGGGIFGAHKVAAEDDSIWLIKPIKHAFPDRFDPELQWGLRGVCTEFIAAKLASRLGVYVPEHTKLYLHQATIDEYSELKDFREGYVIAIEYKDGFDLDFLEKSPALIEIIKSGINSVSNSRMALGIIVADTFMGNADRYSWHIHGGMQASGNKGNLLFTKVPGSADLYNITAIDFGLAFNACRWGSGVASNWPRQLFGMMRFFHKMDWIPEKYSDAEPIFDSWITELLSINIDNEIDSIIKNMPDEWNLSSDPLLRLTNADFDNLKMRLKNHAVLVKPLVSSQYAPCLATVRR